MLVHRAAPSCSLTAFAKARSFAPHRCLINGLAASHVRVAAHRHYTPSRRWKIRHVRTASMGSAGQSLQETAALDELIDMMLAARNQQQLGQVVAENIFSIDPKFWLRVATRNDTASSAEDKERLQQLANSVMMIVDTVVRKTEQQLSDSSKILQEILTAAADDNGEWYLPLTPQQVQNLRDALDRNAQHLDEALLSNAFAWIRKCTEDRFDSMVQLIQKVLQLYSARQLRGPERQGVEGIVNEVIFAEEHTWASIIKNYATGGQITEPAFMEALQKRMEAVVLGLQSGSYAQRVQAEYLKEIEGRAKSVFRDIAGAY